MPSAADTATTATTATTIRQWIAVTVLALSTFVVVTSEMMPIGVLTPMADGLDIGKGTAGLSLTFTGVVTAVTAPLVPRVPAYVDRRVLLAAAMLVLAVGNALTTAANGFTLLLISRITIGIGMGAVWGLSSAVAVRLVAQRHATLAVTLVISGVAAASVVGVPLGTLIGDNFGWRAAFGSLSAAATLLAVALLTTLPRQTPATAPVATVDAPTGTPLLRDPRVATGLLLVAFLVTAHFAAYTYVRPILEDRTGLSSGAVAVSLLVYGVFGVVGNFAAGASAARRARPTLLWLASGIGVSLALLALLGTVTAVTAVVMAVWGLTYGGLSVAGQIWMNQSAPHRTEQVTGLYVGVFTASIALGAFLGGAIVDSGTTPLLWTAAALTAAALAIGARLPKPPIRLG